jgi:hypothetical protein
MNSSQTSEQNFEENQQIKEEYELLNPIKDESPVKKEVRKRSYERFHNENEDRSYHKRCLKYEKDSESHNSIRNPTKSEYSGYSPNSNRPHKPSYYDRRIRHPHPDPRQRTRDPCRRPYKKPSHPPHYMPSVLSGVRYCPPSKRGGEEELRVLDGGKLRKKIYLPRKNGVNYIGLLIGPRGMYQKKLEEDTNCKILIRGNLPLLRRGHREGVYKSEDEDHEHVLIITDSEENMRKAEEHVRKVITATEDERNMIRQEQL